MGKTQQQYKDEHYAAGLKEVDKAHQLRKKTDAATLKQINEAIDKATATQTGQYQQRIESRNISVIIHVRIGKSLGIERFKAHGASKGE